MVVTDFVTQLLAHMGSTSAVVKMEENDNEHEIHITVDEAESGLLIGRHAETLDSLQHIIRLVYQKDYEKPLAVNINDFRQKRSEYLHDLATRIAEKVTQTGRPQILRLSPAERRIVHMVLTDHPSVYTESEGEGVARVLKIFPKA